MKAGVSMVVDVRPHPKAGQMEDWKRHAIILVIVLAISQPLVYAVYKANADLFVQFIILTMTSNLVAQVYAVFIFRIYDQAQNRAVRKAEAEGFHVDSIEDGLAKILPEIRRVKEWLEAQKPGLEKTGDILRHLDVAKLAAFLQFIGRISIAVEKSGLKLTEEEIDAMVAYAKTQIQEALANIKRRKAIDDAMSGLGKPADTR